MNLSLAGTGMVPSMLLNDVPTEWSHEAELVERLRQKDAEAFEMVCLRYEKRLLRTAVRITKNQEDAEDAVQEAFLKAFWRIDSFNGRSSFSTWLTSIVVNVCLMQLRKARCRPVVSLDEPRESGYTWMETLHDKGIDLEADYIQQERSKLLAEAISRLKPKLRAVLLDQHKSDATMADLAAREGISVPAVKSRILRARLALKKSQGIASAL